MKKIIAALFVIAILITVLIIANNNNKIPNGWYPAGSNPSEYEMGIDNSIFQNGQACAYIKSKSPKENQFGTLMQTISAEYYLGKRLMLSGYIKSEEVKGWSGMWMRIDGESNQQLGFDNMRDRVIKGTTDWTRYEIVLDIPANSTTINYGVLLGGDGEVWFDNFELKEVDKNVPVTNLLKESGLPSQPINLDFENN
ncbi:MAG TPA: hypothetical protein VLH59_15315 [Ignavibacteriaceae bacterium]|nr:hypothetical protein [Ignavibacteriaceae bacterium]